MQNRNYYYDNYKNHPEPVLRRLAGEFGKLTPFAQEALRDVLRERNMEDLIPSAEQQQKKKESLAHLSAEEIRAIISSRLDRGEKIDIIKADLTERGVNIYEWSTRESRREEAIAERFLQLQKEGKSKIDIDAQLQKEFNLSAKETTKVPEQLQSNGAWLIVVGAVLLMVCGPLLAVVLQEGDGPRQLRIPSAGLVVGIALLIMGIRKRMAAQKFLRENQQ
jgi:uncharacterized membrane protein